MKRFLIGLSAIIMLSAQSQAASVMTLDLAEGDLSISPSGWTLSDGAENPFSGQYIIESSTPDAGNKLILKGGTDAAPLSVTIRNLMIDMDFETITRDNLPGINITSGWVAMTVEGSNRVHGGTDSPGIEVPDGATLLITAESTGRLEARAGGRYGDGGGAGIGARFSGSAGTLIVNGGDLLCVGNKGGAGFGSGWEWRADGNRSGGTLIMNGGNAVFQGSQSSNSGGTSVTEGVGSSNRATVVQLNGGSFTGNIRNGSNVTDYYGNKMSRFTQNGMNPASTFAFDNLVAPESSASFVSDRYGNLPVWIPEGKTIHDIIGDKVIVAATASPYYYDGYVYGGGFFQPGDAIELSATPAGHNKFDSWDTGESANPVSITVGSEDLAVKAVFVPDVRKMWGGGIISEDDRTAYVDRYMDEPDMPDNLELPETILIGDKEYTVISLGDPRYNGEMIMIDVMDPKSVFTLPYTLQTLSTEAFMRLWGTETICVKATTPPEFMSENNLDYLSSFSLQVPAESLEAYAAHPVWSRCKSISAYDLVTLDLAKGDISISPTGYRQGDGEEIPWGAPYRIISSTPDAGNLLTIAGGTETSPVKVTIDDLLINMNLSSISDNKKAGIEISGGTVEMILKGENRLQGGKDSPGIRVPAAATLIISDESTGSLKSYGGGTAGDGGGAGIGAGCGNSVGTLIVNGGDILAVGCKGGAGFGGAWDFSPDWDSAGSLIINGGVAEFRGSFGSRTGHNCQDGVGTTNYSRTSVSILGGTFIGSISSGSNVSGAVGTMKRVTQTGMTPDAFYSFENMFGENTLVRFPADGSGTLHIWLPDDKELHDVLGEKVIVTGISDPDNSAGKIYGGGFYLPGETVEFRAAPGGRYLFSHWDDENTDNPRTITVGEEDSSLTGVFEIDPVKMWGGGVISEEESTAFVNEYLDWDGAPADLAVPEYITIRDKQYQVISIGHPTDDMSMPMINIFNDKASFIIPESIVNIYPYIFTILRGTPDIYCHAPNPPETIRNVGFTNIDSKTLHVPAESLQLYRDDAHWSKFFRIKGTGPLPASYQATMNIKSVEARPQDTCQLTYTLSADALEAGFFPAPAIEAETPQEAASTADDGARVVWSSDHPEVASVDSNGKVTAIDGGTALITAAVYSADFDEPLLATAALQVKSITNAITDAEVDVNPTVSLFDIHGFKVYDGLRSGLPSTLLPGIYIMVDARNGVAEKIVVR